MIIIENLSVSYGKNQILSDLKLNLQDSMAHGIVGLNGAGKTTFLNTLFGIKKCDQGGILYNNRVLGKKDIAYVESENFFYSNITGNEYLRLFENPKFETEMWKNIFNLPLNKMIDTFSTGMRKKLAILAALKTNKPILILDEPFNGLDIESCEILRLIISKLCDKGKTVIITSHIIDTLPEICRFIHHITDMTIETYVSEDFSLLKSIISDKINDKISLELEDALK